MNDILIRAAALNDAERISEIYAYYVNHTAVSFEYIAPTGAEISRRMEMTVKKYPYLVAEINGRVVGYAYASAFKSRPAYARSIETSIYVDKDQKKQGIGKALYHALETALKKQGILNAYACVTLPIKEDETLSFDSLRFHQKMGYTVVGTFHQCGYKFDRWYHMVWMEKMLGEHT